MFVGARLYCTTLAPQHPKLCMYARRGARRKFGYGQIGGQFHHLNKSSVWERRVFSGISRFEAGSTLFSWVIGAQRRLDVAEGGEEGGGGRGFGASDTKVVGPAVQNENTDSPCTRKNRVLRTPLPASD